MKLKQLVVSLCVAAALGSWVFAGDATKEVFRKGSPVQILTKDKSVAGNLETASDAKEVKVLTVDKKEVTVLRGEIQEIRLIKNCGAKAVQGKIAEARTRGTGNFTEQLSAAFESYFGDKDVKTGRGTLTSIGQVVLDRLHPTSTLTSVKVHDVQLTYKGDTAPKELKDVQKIELRMTLYWKGLGILNTDGWTKVAMTYDNEVGRWTKLDVIDTNGLKNSEIVDAAWKVGVTAFVAWLSSDSNNQ